MYKKTLALSLTFSTVLLQFPMIAGAYATVLNTTNQINTASPQISNVRIKERIQKIDQIEERFRQNEILVKFKGQSRVTRVALPQGDTVMDALATYRGRKDTEYAEPNYIAHAFGVPNDPYYSYQWHFDNSTYGGVHAEDAWDISTGSGVVVAVVDTGVAYENYSAGRFNNYYLAPDLAGTLFVPGYDFVNNDPHPNDDEGHGTHVTGTIAGSTNNGSGVAGLAYNAAIMPVKVLNKFGSGSYADIADGIIFAVDNGADIINLSLGGSSGSITLENALAYAYSNGVVVVAASGNDSASQISYPAAYNNYVIAAGATRFDETRSSYSNYGSGLDIVAPGGDLGVDQNGDGYGDGVLQQTFGNRTNDWGYYFYHGTSMASPHVAAIAALVKANGNATTPYEIRMALQTTADNIGPAGWDEETGWGLVNAVAALAYSTGPVDNPPSITITSPANTATVVASVNITADVFDDNAIDRVDFYVDDALIGTDTTNTYEYMWDSTAVGDGVHTILTVAVDSANQTATESINVIVDNVENPPPPPNLSPVADAGPDQTVYTEVNALFDGSNSNDPDGTIVSYGWDFGDGNTAGGMTPTHTYTSKGNYTVILTVTDNDGATATDSLKVTIEETPPSSVVFYDSFENGEWNNNWEEDGHREWHDSSQRSVDGNYSAEVDGYSVDGALTSRVIDLEGRTNATVSFSWYIENRLDTNEYIAVDISTDDGTSWPEYGRLRGNVDAENTWHVESFDVSGTSSIRIRFRGTMSSSSEDADVDNVSVTAW